MTEQPDELPVHPFTGVTALAVLPSGRPVWPVLGGAPDADGQDDEGAEDDAPEDQDDEGADDNPDQDDDGQDDDEDKPLGPAGEKALKAEKERRRAEAKRRRELEAELAQLKSGGQGDDPETIRREAAQAATAKANTRLLRAEVRAVAAGKLADPKDALLHIDLDQFEVDEDGEIDSEEIADAIETLLTQKPYLAAAPARRFQGRGDGGAARKAARPKQLTKSDLKTMTPEQIEQARTEGRLDNVLGGK